MRSTQRARQKGDKKETRRQEQPQEGPKHQRCAKRGDNKMSKMSREEDNRREAMRKQTSQTQHGTATQEEMETRREAR